MIDKDKVEIQIGLFPEKKVNGGFVGKDAVN